MGNTRLLDRKDDESRKLSSCDESIGERVGDTATFDECGRDLDLEGTKLEVLKEMMTFQLYMTNTLDLVLI
jgi:hypothetical protein